jgi:hypothetical protein
LIRSDKIILFKEEEMGSFDKLVFFNYLKGDKFYFCMVEFDSVDFEIYQKSDENKKDSILIKYIELNKVSKIEEVTSNEEFQKWLSKNSEAKEKLRDFKINKLIN